MSDDGSIPENSTDAMDHLAAAARDLIGAARSVLDAMEMLVEEHLGAAKSTTTPRDEASAAAARVRRIDLD